MASDKRPLTGWLIAGQFWWLKWLAIGLLAGAVFLAIQLGQNRAVEEYDSLPPEVKLAAVDTNLPAEELSKEDAKEYLMLLNALEVKTKNSEDEIVKIILNARDVADRNNLEESALDLMRRFNSSMPEESKGAIDLKEVAAAYLVLRGAK